MLKQGRFSEAIQILKPLAEKPSDDQLLYLMDYATALQLNGQYAESNKALIQADKLTDINDYHSVTRVVGATLGGEEAIQYKGESFEKYLINTMAAINYVALGQLDDALVEARRINEKITKMKMDGRDPYELSPFATYLTAILWEADRKWDDAYISYEQTYNLGGENYFLKSDLVRSAKKARREESYQKWKSAFGDIVETKDKPNQATGEIVVLGLVGWGPEKITRSENARFPRLNPSYSLTKEIRVDVNGASSEETREIYNIEKAAITTLEKDFAALVGRRVGALVGKAIVADQIRQKNKLLGDLTWIAMNIADRADLRNWSTLPAGVAMAKISLPAGQYQVVLRGLNAGGEVTGETRELQNVKVVAGKKTFLVWRPIR